MKQGDIVFVDFPYTDLSNSKKRPALIISNNKDPHEKDLILCEITTKNRNKGEVEINNRDLTKGRLHKKSFVRPNKIATVHMKKVVGPAGTLKKQAVCEVIARLNEYLTP